VAIGNLKAAQDDSKVYTRTHSAGRSPTEKNEVFYVYHDQGGSLNHFVVSGREGDYGDIKIDDGDSLNPKSGKTNIKITYSAASSQGANFVHMYWNSYGNYWGSGPPPGIDLRGYTRLTFWAKGKRKDGKPVVIDEFKIGGDIGKDHNSAVAMLGPIELSEQWTLYSIPLQFWDLSSIYTGFSWKAERKKNPVGFELFLDEIRYEKGESHAETVPVKVPTN